MPGRLTNFALVQGAPNGSAEGDVTAADVRERDEMQRAHDSLAAVILGEVPGLVMAEEDRQSMIPALDVLCWVLKHEHNATFAGNLAGLDESLAAAGYVIKVLPRRMTVEEARAEGLLGGDAPADEGDQGDGGE